MEVNIKSAIQTLRMVKQRNDSTHRYKIVPFIHSAPGIGKSAIIKQLAAEWGMDLIDLRLSTRSILDLAGVPYKHELEDGSFETRWARPDFARQKGNYILFLDELTSAPPAVQSAAYEIMLDRRVGGHPLPEDVFIVGAGNRLEDRGVVHEMPVPLRNRMLHITLTPSVDDFISYGMSAGIDDGILAYLKLNPADLHRMPKGQDMAFPTPRSWEFLSSMMHMNPTQEVMGGLVGDGVAAGLSSFLKLRGSLPDVPALLKKGEAWTTTDPSLQYAFIFSLVTHYKNQFSNLTQKKGKSELTERFLTIVAEQPEEIMILAFFLIKDFKTVISFLYDSQLFQNRIVKSVASVLKS